VAEPELDIWEWLRDSYPSHVDHGRRGRAWSSANQFSSGNMLVAAMYAGRSTRASVSGMRAEESRGRRMNRIVRGPIYRQLVDERGWCCQSSTGRRATCSLWRSHAGCQSASIIVIAVGEVFDLAGVAGESRRLRADEDKITARGAMVHLRVLYPNLWSRLVSLRPELMKETYHGKRRRRWRVASAAAGEETASERQPEYYEPEEQHRHAGPGAEAEEVSVGRPAAVGRLALDARNHNRPPPLSIFSCARMRPC
jgi:hypothetical protein